MRRNRKHSSGDRSANINTVRFGQISAASSLWADLHLLLLHNFLRSRVRCPGVWAAWAHTKVCCMEITAQQFREIGQQRELPQGPRIAFAALLALALAVTITQPAPLVGMLMLAVAFAGCIVVWWKFMRRSGERFNNYDPLKPDTEMQRTATDWKEEFRLVAVVAASFVLVNLGRIWPGWISGLIVGVIGFAVFFYLLGRKPSRPEKYTLPEELVAGRDASAVVATGNDALLAGMYALKMVTGGVQIQKHIAVDHLTEALRMNPAEIHEAIEAAKSRKDIASIKELRSRDTANEWLTLTPKTSHAFQKRMRGE